MNGNGNEGSSDEMNTGPVPDTALQAWKGIELGVDMDAIALMTARRKSDGETVTLICLIGESATLEGGMNLTPLAVLLNPTDLYAYEPPMNGMSWSAPGEY
jgi:hypothetical protein